MSAAYHQLATVQIPRGMLWVDEFNWVPVEKTAEYSTTGALLLDVGTKLAGQPITLQAVENQGWFRRGPLQELLALASDAEGVYTFTHADGRAYLVTFAPDDPVSAVPIGRPELPGSDNPYIVTVRLIVLQTL